ncbi:hypothetical protein BHE74_00014603 [Ensete ventricosum]|nr:hypothetical protein BHE74_00014603 [Ensete ventricosum]
MMKPEADFDVLLTQVSVPGNSMFNVVTVRCGHCANLLSVNMGALLQAFPLQDFQVFMPFTDCHGLFIIMSLLSTKKEEKESKRDAERERLELLVADLQWAHFPHIHFGLTLDGSKQVKLDDAIAAAPGGEKAPGFY